MAGLVACQRAESALRFLLQKVDQLEGFHIGNFLLALRDFCDFFERDDALLHVVAALRRKLPRTGKDWADEAVRTGTVPALPKDPVGCFAFRFDTMRAVRTEKIDLRYFVSSFYPGAHLNEKLAGWKRQIVHPFARDCRKLAGRLLELLPEATPGSEYVDMEALVADGLSGFEKVAFGARAWTDADDEAPVPPPPPGKAPRAKDRAGAGEPASLEDAIVALESAAKAAKGLSPAKKHDFEVDMKILVLEAKKKGRDRARIEARLDALPQVPGLAPALLAVRKKLSRP